MTTYPAVALLCASVALTLGGVTSSRSQGQPTGGSNAAAADPAAADPAAANPVAAQPLPRLSATRERPLFSPSRRPPAAPPPTVVVRAEPTPPPPAPSLTLFGVVADQDGAHAVVRTASADRTVRVRIGDEIEGWKVEKIESRRLVLSLDGRSAVFTLFDGTSRPNAGPAAVAQQGTGPRPAGRVRRP